MAYIALKASRFDRKYAIGELIPDGVVDPRAAASLVAMGRIVRDVNAVQSKQEPAGEAGAAGGVDTQAETETPAGEPTAAKAARKKTSAKK